MTKDPQNPEVVTTVTNDIEAASIVTALSAHGIRATTTGGYTAAFRAEAPGLISVIVRQADLDEARQVLAQLQQNRSSTDWSQIDIGQPEM